MKHVNRSICKTCLLIPVKLEVMVSHVQRPDISRKLFIPIHILYGCSFNRGTFKDFQDISFKMENNFRPATYDQFKSKVKLILELSIYHFSV